jgi:hypothetical protein
MTKVDIPESAAPNVHVSEDIWLRFNRPRATMSEARLPNVPPFPPPDLIYNPSACKTNHDFAGHRLVPKQ